MTNSTEKTAVALGFFDGVHIAHQKIILAAVHSAKADGLRPLALSFDVPPALILRGEAPPQLTDIDEKRRLISALGADCVLLPTTRELLGLTGREFAEKVLIGELNAAHAVCGYNYRFGRDRLGAEELRALGRELGFVTEVLPEERLSGGPVSSSRIRELLSAGRISEAEALLGRPYEVTGVVERGKRLGRTMGFPTVNIYPGPLPLARGVYATKITVGGQEHTGVTNVGVNPTVHDSGMRVETHIPGFGGDLYGQVATVCFVCFVRPEQTFPSVEALFAQIGRDTEYVTAYFEGRENQK